MSVEGLVEAIVADAEAEASAMLERADEEAREIVEAARRHALQRVVTARMAAEQAALAEAAAALNALRLRVVGTHAATLSDWLERVFTAAVKEAAAIGDGGDPERWELALRRLVEEAAALAGAGARCAVRSVDAATVRTLVDAAGVPLEVAVEPGLPPGLLSRSADGRVEVDATLPVRARRAREQLAGHVARLLGADDLPRAVAR